MFCSAELWTKNNYQSCNLPSQDDDVVVDDDDDDDDADDDADDDDAKSKDINYVIGDVLQPQNADNTDALIVHCVGQSTTAG